MCIWSESSWKHLGFVKRNYTPPFSQHWWNGKQCATGLAAVSRYVRPSFKDTFVYETALCGCYQSQKWSYAVLVLFCDFSFVGYVQSMEVHWALLSNISMGYIAIMNWNLHHLLWIKSFELCLFVFLLFKKLLGEHLEVWFSIYIFIYLFTSLSHVAWLCIVRSDNGLSFLWLTTCWWKSRLLHFN